MEKWNVVCRWIFNGEILHLGQLAFRKKTESANRQKGAFAIKGVRLLKGCFVCRPGFFTKFSRQIKPVHSPHWSFYSVQFYLKILRWVDQKAPTDHYGQYSVQTNLSSHHPFWKNQNWFSRSLFSDGKFIILKEESKNLIFKSTESWPWPSNE